MSQPTPGISLFKLAEYIGADIQLRTEIVRGAIPENEAAARAYSRARDRLPRAFESTPPYRAGFERVAEELGKMASTSDWDRRDLDYSAADFQTLADMVDGLRLGDAPPRPPRSRWRKLELAGVRVSITPDLLLWEKQDDVVNVGALKVAWSQREMGEEEGLYASTILRVSLRREIHGEEFKVRPALCQVVNASTGQVFEAPRTFKRRMRRLEKACEEYRARWLEEFRKAWAEAARDSRDTPPPAQPRH
jgi:hypothetical protein